MQQNAPIESGLASFAQAFGDQVAKGSANEQKEAFNKWKLNQTEGGKNTRQDKALQFKANHPASKTTQDPKDKNFLNDFKTYQSEWLQAVKNFTDSKAFSKDPIESQNWKNMTNEQKNQLIAQSVNDPNTELGAAKEAHDFIYNPQNLARKASLRGEAPKSGDAGQQKPAGSVLDLQNVPVPTPSIGNQSGLPMQAQPTPGPQIGQAPQVAQAPPPKLRFPMAPATPEDVHPMVASLPGGPTNGNTPVNSPIPGQGPANSQNEEEVG